MKLLIRMKHGLGDNMQCALVIKHIKNNDPGIYVGVEARQGTHSCYYGIADEVYVMGTERRATRSEWDKVLQFPFTRAEGYMCPDVPQTKVTRCLQEYTDEEPDPSLYTYEIHPSDEAESLADRYIKEELDNKPFAILHYEGVAARDGKNMEPLEAAAWLAMIEAHDLEAVLFQWGGLPIPFTNIHNPGMGHYLWKAEGFNGKVGDAGVIAALAKRAEYWIGIDSGPEHVMAGTETPGYVLWFHHHPIHCFDYGKEVTHIVPYNVAELTDTASQKIFEKNYHHFYYPEDFESWLKDLVVECVG